jgi:hypothetical protein
MSDWVEVKNCKKLKNDMRRQQRIQEEDRWKTLKEKAPWIIIPARAQRIRRKLNISKLDEKLLSNEWINYQVSGWNYVRVVRPDDKDPLPTSDSITEYSLLSLDNGWNDKVLFSRVVKIP